MPLYGSSSGASAGKPAGGWAKTDLTTAVQTSLTKADQALPAGNVGAPNGIAPLDASGEVPMANLPIVVLTEAAYQALATKDAGTLYFRTP